MKEVRYPNMDKIMMFNDVPFDPVTKTRRTKPSSMDCKIDTRYDTGIIICKDESNGSSIWKVILITIMLLVIAVFMFSIEIEVKHLDEFPLVVFFLSYYQFFIVIGVVIVVIAVIIKRIR